MRPITALVGKDVGALVGGVVGALVGGLVGTAVGTVTGDTAETAIEDKASFFTSAAARKCADSLLSVDMWFVEALCVMTTFGIVGRGVGL